MSAEGTVGLRVMVAGAAGNMGRTVCRTVAAADGMHLAAAVDPRLEDGAPVPTEVWESLGPGGEVFPSVGKALAEAHVDVLVDFTWADAARETLPQVLEAGVAAVVGTTGLDEEFLRRMDDLAHTRGTAVLIAPNFALGAVLMMEFARRAAEHFDHCEVVEMHHERKRDAPSGTARRTADLISSVWAERGREADVPTHSVRLPGVVADQEVVFGALGQTLRVEHRTTSRESFMPGVVLAVRKVGDLQGLVVGLENIL